MFQVKIEKTTEGFILREHRYTAIASTAGAVVAALTCVVLFCLAGYLDTVRRQIGGYLMAVIMAAVAIEAGCFAAVHWDRRLVLDREGCRLQGLFLKGRLIPWDTVRDCGVTYKAARSYSRRAQRTTSHIYTLYISPTRLSFGEDGREVRRGNRAATLSIKGDDVDELFSHAVFDFCEEQINRGRNEMNRVKPCIASGRRSED